MILAFAGAVSVLLVHPQHKDPLAAFGETQMDGCGSGYILSGCKLIWIQNKW